MEAAPLVRLAECVRSLVLLLALFASAPVTADTVFYLHGKIVEDLGDGAVHPQYGEYKYSEIVAALEQAGHKVISEIRPASTDRAAYAAKVVGQIEALLDQGLAPEQLTVVGFSKGAQIAIHVSQALGNPKVRFVLQAVCGRWVASRPDVRLIGEVLSMYERSDGAGSCERLFERSNLLGCEIALNTGLRHGLFYQPRNVWLQPLLDWLEDGASSQACSASMVN